LKTSISLICTIDRRITHFIGDKPVEARKKLLVGFNMYGALFTPARRPIIGREYIELLEKYQPTLSWDSESEESFCEISDENGEGEIWYPTLYSIKFSPTLLRMLIWIGNVWRWWKILRLGVSVYGNWVRYFFLVIILMEFRD
jgi:spore germination protein YaaH